MFIKRLFGMALGVLLLPAVAASAVIPASAPMVDAPSTHGKARKMTTVTKKNHASKVHLISGDILTVKLNWSPGTGYGWSMKNEDQSFLHLEGEPKSEPAKHPKPGAAEVMVFQFKAMKEGTTTLELVLNRPFEKNAEPLDSFKIKVEISAK